MLGRLTLAVILGSGLPLAGQDSAPSRVHRTFSNTFGLELPKTWRAMTPDEMFELEASLPYVMREVQPNFYYSVGDVDRWLKDGFDGRAIHVHILEGDLSLDEAGIEKIRTSWAAPPAGGGPSREVVSAELTQLGPDLHSAIRCRIRTAADGNTPPIESLEFYVPTHRHVLILSFRSWQDDFQSVASLYESMADSATFARPPRKPEELSDRLLNAVLVGGLVGLALIAVRLMRRR